MAKEFFKNTSDAFKVLLRESKEAGKRFAESEAVRKVAADVRDAAEKVGDEISHQVKKLYKVCPVCGRKMAASDNYCASCGNPLPAEPVIWEEAETAEAAEVPAAEEACFVEAPVAEETAEE